MAKTRIKKESEVSRYTQSLASAKAVVFADLSALKVSESSELRQKAKEEELGVLSAKKTLLRLALEESKLEADQDALKGGITMVVGSADEVAPAKFLDEFRKTHEHVLFLGGFINAGWMSAPQVEALAKLPSRQQLIANVVSMVRSPLSGLVGVLQGNLRGLVCALDAIKESKSS